MALLDETGLARLWEKVKLYVDAKLSGITVEVEHPATREGTILIGDMCIEFGQVSITSGTSTAQSVYKGTADITFANKFTHTPCIVTSFSGTYDNMKACGSSAGTTTGATIWARLSTASATRTVQWMAIGMLAQGD